MGSSTDFANAVTGVTRRYDGSGNLLWQAVHAGEGVSAVRMDTSGRVTVAGPSGAGAAQRFVVRYSSVGGESWTRAVPVESSMWETPMTADEVGSAWLAVADPSGDVVVVKWQADGQEAWRATYGTAGVADEPRALAESGGALLVTGWSSASPDALTARIDGFGVVAWTSTASPGTTYYAAALAPSGLGVLVGNRVVGNVYSLVTVSYDVAGNVAWEKTYEQGVGFGGSLTSVIAGQDGSVFASGTVGLGIAGNEAGDVQTMRYSAAGSVAWTVNEPPLPRQDRFLGPVADADGSVTVASSTIGLEGSELRRYTATGSLTWSRSVPTLTAIAADGQGGILGLGPVTTLGNRDARIERFSREGDLVWRTTYDYSASGSMDSAYAAAADPAGNAYVLINSVYSLFPIPPQLVAVTRLVKYDTVGNVVWTRDPIVAGGESPTGLAVDAAGSAYLWGTTVVLPLNVFQFWLARYEPDGTLGWTRTWRSADNGDAFPFALSVDGQGNPVLVGLAYRPVLPAPGIPDYYVVLKYDRAGRLLWEKKVDPGGDDAATSVTTDRFGNVTVTGVSGQAGGADVFTVSYDRDGAERWSHLYSTGITDQGKAPVVTASLEGAVTVAARKWNGTDTDLVVLRYDTSGSLRWASTLMGDVGGHDAPTAVVADASGAVTVAGIASRGTSGEDGLLARFAAEPAPRAYYTLTPCRLFDSRDPGHGGPTPLSAGVPRDLKASGACGVPETARAVAVNVTVTEASAPGNLRLFLPGFPMPLASTANYLPGQTRANNAIAALGADGRMGLLASQGTGTLHVIVDVTGYLE